MILGKNKMVVFGAENCVELLFATQLTTPESMRIDKELD